MSDIVQEDGLKKPPTRKKVLPDRLIIPPRNTSLPFNPTLRKLLNSDDSDQSNMDENELSLNPRTSSRNHNRLKKTICDSDSDTIPESLRTQVLLFGHRPPPRMLMEKIEEFFPSLADNEEFMKRTSSLNKMKPKVLTPEITPPQRTDSLWKRISSTSSSPSQSPITPIELVPPARRSSFAAGQRLIRAESTEQVQFKRLADYLKELHVGNANLESLERNRSKSEELSLDEQSEIDNESINNLVADLETTNIEWVRSYLLGRGTFGKVYLGLNIKTCQFMAVKQVELAVPERGGKNWEKLSLARKRVIQSLHQEVSLLNDLEHENIVQYLGFDVSDNMISLFLEYVSGGSASTLLARLGEFKEDLVQSLVKQILSGLRYLHERGIIHRDIKCANILVNESGVAKIADFGISTKHECLSAYRYNSRLSLQGTIFWMAPEVIKEKGYSAKVDIWSLGCVMLEMFTGSHPWRQLDALQAMWKLGKDTIPPIPPNLSEQATDFLQQCFVIQPDERPTAATLLDHPFVKNFEVKNFNFQKYYLQACKRKVVEPQEWFDGESTYGSIYVS